MENNEIQKTGWHLKPPFIWTVATVLVGWIVVGFVRFALVEHEVFAAQLERQEILLALHDVDDKSAKLIHENTEAIRETLDIVRRNKWEIDARSKQLQRIENAVDQINTKIHDIDLRIDRAKNKRSDK
jgi:uncharacterized membrane protein